MQHDILGRVPEWPNGADCKSVGNAFGGSNPSSPTLQKFNSSDRRVDCSFVVLSNEMQAEVAQLIEH